MGEGRCGGGIIFYHIFYSKLGPEVLRMDRKHETNDNLYKQIFNYGGI